MLFKRVAICVLSVAVCASLFGCVRKEVEDPDISVATNDQPLIPQINKPVPESERLTPVYASAFGDTVILAAVPLQEWHGQEIACPAREISNGGRIKCNGEHEQQTPITKVVILEDVVPRNCGGWFRDMLHLEKVDGMEKLHTHSVTDMNHMFTGCERLTELDVSSWDVSKVEDMTGMFDGCAALTDLPDWYE